MFVRDFQWDHKNILNLYYATVYRHFSSRLTPESDCVTLCAKTFSKVFDKLKPHISDKANLTYVSPEEWISKKEWGRSKKEKYMRSLHK